MAQDEAKKEQKNKNLTTKKKKETTQAIKLYNQPTTTLDLRPHVASLQHQGPQTVSGMWRVQSNIVCVFGEVLCPAAAEQDICRMQSGQVRETEDRNKEAESVADKHSAYQRRTCAVSQLSKILAESRQLRIHTRKEMFPGFWLGCCDAHTEKLLLLLKKLAVNYDLYLVSL